MAPDVPGRKRAVRDDLQTAVADVVERPADELSAEPAALERRVDVRVHEHDEAGHITEDLAIRNRMVEKRLAKAGVLRGDFRAPVLSGADDYEMLIVSWGSTAGAAAEAAGLLRAEGTSASALHFPQVWPFVKERFLPALEKAKRVICVEGNATGQFARLVRRETGFEMERLGRYDGLSITPEYIVRGLRRSGGAE